MPRSADAGVEGPQKAIALLRGGETLDAALGGTVAVIQPERGYRFALDSVLLARFAAERARGETAVDLGCGCGVVGLCLLGLRGADRLLGVDVQAPMVDRARRSAQRNGWDERASFVVADIRQISRVLPGLRVPLVVCNPPYRPVAAGKLSPEPSVALARAEVACTARDVAGAGAYLLQPRGSLCTVYPAGRLASLLAAARGAGLAARAVRCVHPRAGEKASLVLAQFMRGGKEALDVLPPLILHGERRRYSEEAERLLGPP